ncbi:hypothetical protein AB0I49_34105 [Streptomyces sp. NPDC050617]|uniref:hypothetical protein n=1 Tax=Streptomyces sp. NPDC050617 TaxID=3154628 RepID=UPI0034294680
MNSFVRDSRAEAPSYLCWQADTPVGKTALLADYVSRRPPADADILTFFVSAAHGTDTRAEFEEEIVDQIDVFLGRQGSPVPSNVRGWKTLFAEAAAKSARYGRKLLLVVDGLDDDVAWSGLAAEGRTSGTSGMPGSRGDATEPKAVPVRGSIAALLPSRPPPGMRVIVSLRRCVRFPDDLPPVRHPLRQSRYLRTLLPVAGVPLLRQPPPDAAVLGAPVAGLLAVAGGGLRTTDLAELTGLPVERLDRLAQGPAGRALVTEDAVSRTYALADPRLVREVREDLGAAGISRHTHELLTWSRRWRAAGWPDGTPPYPLGHQLRLLTDTAERAAYVLDLPRLRRLAATAGPDAAFAQLVAFEADVGGAAAASSDGDELATLVPLSAARTLLRQETRDVPDGAASLFVRLGDAERARGLARSAPTTVARAVHLADVAVELAYAGRADPDAVAVVREAVEWLARDRAHQGFPGAFRDPESYARLLGAARTLAALNGSDAARPLLLAVLQDPAAGTEALVEAAGMLDPVRDADAVAVLRARAETLSAGGLRARAAAVDLWGALARAAPSLGPYAGDRIEAVCEELGDADGLGAVDVLATAASALIALPAKRHRRAAELTQMALARMRTAFEALRDPVSLSEEDRAHLRRELAGTLARLAEAVADPGGMRGGLDAIRRLMETLPEGLRIGVLGDPLLERAQWTVEAAEDERERLESKAAAVADEKRRAERRGKDAEREAWDKERKEWEEKRKAEKEEERDSLREARTRRVKAQAAQAEPEVARSAVPTRHKPTPRRPAPHRRSAGLPSPSSSPSADPLPLEADDQLGAGNLLRSRELLEAALRNRPATQLSKPANTPPTTGDWTVDLCQAMGAAGESDEAEALAQNLPDTRDRARHLAALSLGCSLAGYGDSGTRYAQAAACALPDGAAPELANAVAQALAHTGDEPAASAMATGGSAAQRRQALTAVAAGLVRHCPEGAARVAGPLVEALVRRIEAGGQGSPLAPLPELAALLLAFPDVRHPDPRLSDALHRAALHAAAPAMSWPTRSMAVLALLARLGCLPDEDAYVVASSIDRWRRALQPGEEPSAELALLAAVDGDPVSVWRHADAARTPDDRMTAFRFAATHLAGVRVALATDSGADDRALRTCLALARASGGGSLPDEPTARHITLGLLRSEGWTYTIPLLPTLAPGALGHLGAMAKDVSRHTEGHTEGAADRGASS